MLDVISGGRLVAGFPVGTPMDTNFCYGQIPALTRDKYREAHDLIMQAWAEDEPFAFDGKYNQLRWVNCWPKPIQKPHPPIYIPGGGSIETWDFCLDHDYNYSYLSFYGYLRGKSLLDGYWERVAKRGKDDSPYRAAFAQIICVADTDAEAEELYAEHCLYFFNRCLHVFPPFADPPGYRTVNTIKYGANPRRCDTRRPALVWRVRIHRLKSFKRPEQSGKRGCSAVGSAQPCQGWGREFESRHPLECRGVPFEDTTARGVNPHGGVAERLGTGLQSRLHGFESRRHLQYCHSPQLNSPNGRDWRSGSALP